MANRSAAAFFWNWLKYIDSHSGLVWKGYGTGKSQSGVTPPAGWLSWNPASVDPVPWGDNSWVVFEAENADPLLNGGGGMPWQCKLQTTLATAFDDCNAADIDYGKEGSTYAVCGRVCATGGWNETTLDFTPIGGEEGSDNHLWWGGDSSSGLNEYFNLEIVGDDDTIVWNGAGYDTPGYPEQTAWQNRNGYLGMIQRRSSVITYPFYYQCGRLGDISYGAGEREWNRKNEAWYWDAPWPSYSLWKDGTKVTTHWQDTWDGTTLTHISRHVESGEDVILSCLLAQWQAPSKFAIIGEYRLLGAVGFDWGYHEVRGTDPQWFQFCYDPAAEGGMAMRWPVGEIPIW